MSSPRFGSVQQMETIEETVSFEDYKDGTSPPPYAFPPGVLNGAYPREEAVSESSEQPFPASEKSKKRR